MQQKIILEGDTMESYSKLKEEIITNPNVGIKYFHHGGEFVQEFIVDSDDEIRYYHASYNICFTSKFKPYLIQKNSQSFSFNKKTKKLKSVNCNFLHLVEIIKKINIILNVEWFNNFNLSPTYNSIELYVFYKKIIIEKVWGKVITNPEDLIKFYMKYCLHIKNISWKKIREFLKKSNGIYFENYILKYIDELVINPNNFIDKLIYISKNNREYLNDYREYIIQIAALQIKSNVGKWSLQRFLDEHNKTSLLLMDKDIQNKSNEPIFSNDFNLKLPQNINCRFINDEQLCFKESSVMHNCIYVNYWNRIKQLEYFAISVDDKKYGRATVGISYRKDSNSQLIFYVDQIRGKRNSKSDDELINIINEWIDDNQNIFHEILEKYKKKNLDNTNKVITFVEDNDLFLF